MRRFGSALAALLLVAATSGAAAQSTIQIAPQSSSGPPVAFGPEWKYERRGSDVHMFICQEDSCDRSSRVSYRLYARNDTMTLEAYRREQEKVVQALTERGRPGTRIEILSIEGDDTKTLPRMYKAKRLKTNEDGRREYLTAAVVLGQGSSASLISSSSNQKAADANHALFALALMLVVNRAAP